MRTPLSNNLTYHEANLHKSLSRLYFSSHLNWWSISSILLDRLKNLLLRFYPTTALIGKTQHCKHFYCHFLWRCKWAIWSLRDFCGQKPTCQSVWNSSTKTLKLEYIVFTWHLQWLSKKLDFLAFSFLN